MQNDRHDDYQANRGDMRCGTGDHGADNRIQVDVMGMLLSILQIVVIPIGLGLIVHHLLPKVVKAVHQNRTGARPSSRRAGRWRYAE
jgi:hypothetical protein